MVSVQSPDPSFSHGSAPALPPLSLLVNPKFSFPVWPAVNRTQFRWRTYPRWQSNKCRNHDSCARLRRRIDRGQSCAAEKFLPSSNTLCTTALDNSTPSEGFPLLIGCACLFRRSPRLKRFLKLNAAPRQHRPCDLGGCASMSHRPCSCDGRH